MQILENCSMMLLLDCSNRIVVHFMAPKHGALILKITKLHNYTTHTWILGPLSGQPHIHCQLQQRTLRFSCSIQNNNNTFVSACWKYASNNAKSPLGYNIAQLFLEIITVLTFYLI